MAALTAIITILLVAAAIVLIATVLLQPGESSGLGAIAGGAETFFGKNKGRTMEAKLEKYTKIAGVVFFVLALVSSLLVLFGA